MSYSAAEVMITPATEFDVEGGSPAVTASKARETTTTQFVSECSLPTPRGRFRLRAYRHEGNGRSLEPVVMVTVSMRVYRRVCFFRNVGGGVSGCAWRLTLISGEGEGTNVYSGGQYLTC